MTDRLSRRGFLRAAGLGALGVAAAACSGGAITTASPTPTASGPASPAPPRPSPTLRTLGWRRLDAARGPGPRKDHSFTGDPEGARAYLFGGRRGSDVLADTWVLDVERASWEQVSGRGPSARFGHNAELIGTALIVFGGQRGGTLLNDTWALDTINGEWRELSPGGTTPGIRYGASSARADDTMLVSHGFNFQGRFADTLQLSITKPARWADLTPSGGLVPVKRCLHRGAWLQDLGMMLVGGQTDGTPFLEDTWLFDVGDRRWQEVPGDGPGARNLFALVGVGGQAYLFGGFTPDGVAADTWNFDGAAWRKLSPEGRIPSARGGIEGALLADSHMLTFGGSDGSTDLDDLWELTLPGVG